MLTLSSSTYKKDDYIAFAVLFERDLGHLMKCRQNREKNCSSCWYKKSCYDLCSMYEYIVEKTK